jgi:hypothetical protein
MRGRYLLGLSNANRQAAGVVTGDEVEVEVEVDAEPPVVLEPEDFARALDADPVARSAYDRLPYSQKRDHVRAIETAKKPETRARRVEKATVTLLGPQAPQRSSTMRTRSPARPKKAQSLTPWGCPTGSWKTPPPLAPKR